MIGNTLFDVIQNIWPMLVIFMVVIVVVRICYLKLNKKEFVLYREVINLLFLIYVLLLFELVTNKELGGAGINLVPFTEIFRYQIGSQLFYHNVLGNVAIFVPFGYFISSYIKAKHILYIFIITFITSITIEIVQLRIGRAMDIDDVILNVLGGMIGFLIYVALNTIRKHLPGILQKDFIYNLICIILLGLFIFYVFKKLNMWWF